jgi:hypothetical protein
MKWSSFALEQRSQVNKNASFWAILVLALALTAPVKPHIHPTISIRPEKNSSSWWKFTLNCVKSLCVD